MGSIKQAGGSYYLDPFGCVKNQVDAETMMAILDRSDWSRTEDSSNADLIIINSCGFIESAKQESINAVLSYRKQYPEKKILLAGCLAKRYPGELSESLPEADALFGNTNIAAITKTANSITGRGDDSSSSPEFFPHSLLGDRPLLSLPGQAYVKISEGCNNRCSFCAIPGIRGPLQSRPIPRVLDECRRLLERGIGELCLIGQDLGSYGADLGGAGLPELLEALSSLEGHFWVRFLYIHPDNFPRPILEVCRRDKRFLPYFDLPFQHGSAKILRAMNRRLDPGAYLSLLGEIREILPDVVIRSTFLTGFPGETEEDFQELLDFQARADLDWVGVFAYSREEDTPAYNMKGRVSKKTAAQRKTMIEEQQTGITERRMDRFIGRALECLIEETVDEEDVYLGRLYCQAPEVDGSTVIRSDRPLTPGTFIQGRVFARSGFDLELSPS
ncbi:MAG: 30S ribosomal protein S12 methylthiotransferase RimO [Treponema sp.]|nr:30S ribosomal protein S12 methylthiotransferase RimO [Treponema sp.]